MHLLLLSLQIAQKRGSESNKFFLCLHVETELHLSSQNQNDIVLNKGLKQYEFISKKTIVYECLQYGIKQKSVTHLVYDLEI